MLNPVLSEVLDRWERRRREIPAFGPVRLTLNSPVNIPIGTIVVVDPNNPSSVIPVTVPYQFALGVMISPTEVQLTEFYCDQIKPKESAHV